MSTKDIYVDGSYRNEKATYGVYVGQNSKYNTNGSVPGKQTALRAECEAIRQGVLTIKKMHMDGITTNHYTVRSDSQAAITAIENSNGGEASDIVNDAIAQIKYLEQRNVTVRVSYVPGHSNNTGNDQAHQLANQAR